MKVLVSSAGCVNGVNVIKALKEKYEIVACDADKLSAGLYLADKHYVIAPFTDEYNYIGDLGEIACAKEDIDIIIPTHSGELPVLALNREYFIRRGLKMLLSSYEVYELTENKVKCNAYLESIGIHIPKQYPKEFPVMVKPIIGSGSKNTNIANNKEELKVFCKKDMFYEEKIDGTEYTIDGISDGQMKMICALPRIRIEKKGGLATKSTTINEPRLVDLAKFIVESMGVVGAFNIQCIERDNKYYVIDVNIRFPSGGLPLDVASGMNTPEMMIDLLQGKKVNPKLVYGKTMLRYLESLII